MVRSSFVIFALLAALGAFAASPPAEPLRVLTADPKISCDDARKEIAKAISENRNPNFADLAAFNACQAREYNKANPKNPVAWQLKRKDSRVFFDLVEIKDAQKVKQACLDLVTFEAVRVAPEDPASAIIIGAGGKYSCDAYFRAAAENSPLLILAPTYVPGYYLTKDAAKKIEAEGTKIIERTKKAKAGPEDFVAPAVTIPAKVFCGLVKC